MRAAKAVVFGGLIAGAIDIVYAFVAYGLAFGAQPVGILHTIAGGLLGREAAVAGGMQTAALGLLLHFVIATGMAAAYVIASRVLPILLRLPLIFGALYGVALYGAMNYGIVPHSALQGKPPEGTAMWISLFAHIVLVGPAIALVAARVLKSKP